MTEENTTGILGHNGIAYERHPREEMWLEVDIVPPAEGAEKAMVVCRKHPAGSQPELMTIDQDSPLLQRDPLIMMGWVLRVELLGVNRFQDLGLVELPFPAESGAILLSAPMLTVRAIEPLVG